MNRSISKTAFFSGLALAAFAPWAAASCATTDSGRVGEERPSTLPDGAPADAGSDVVAPDGGCDATDPECVVQPISCAEAAWCPVPTNVANLYALTAVWGSSKTDVWASGSGGTVLHWDGAAWALTPVPSETNLPIKNTFHGLWGSGPNDVWVASATDVIFHTDGFKNGTAVWTRVKGADANALYAAPIYTVWGAGGEARFGGTPFYFTKPNGDSTNANQVIGTTADGGVGWSSVEGNATVHGLWGTSADDLWLVGDNSNTNKWQVGFTLHGVRKGDEIVWTEVDSQASAVLLGIWGNAANDIWTVGESGTIRHFTGHTGTDIPQWQVVNVPTNQTFHSVWGSSPTDVWAVGESGTIFHWNGTEWTTSVAAFPVNRKRPNLYGVWGSGPDDVWVVGDGITLHHTGGAK